MFFSVIFVFCAARRTTNMCNYRVCKYASIEWPKKAWVGQQLLLFRDGYIIDAIGAAHVSCRSTTFSHCPVFLTLRNIQYSTFKPCSTARGNGRISCSLGGGRGLSSEAGERDMFVYPTVCAKETGQDKMDGLGNVSTRYWWTHWCGHYSSSSSSQTYFEVLKNIKICFGINKKKLS